MSSRIALFDPSHRLAAEVAAAAARADVEVTVVMKADDPALLINHAALIAPAVAAELAPASADTAPRWIVGDIAAAPRLAGAAATAGAQGVIISPVSPEALRAAVGRDDERIDDDVRRARKLVAASVIEASAQPTLAVIAEAFAAQECIVWWRDGDTMEPAASRDAPSDGYRVAIGAGARIAAAAAGTVILPASATEPARSVIAEPLRASVGEIAGLIAIVADSARRYSVAERTDLRALAARVTRELSWMAGHRRLVAEGERMAATSQHDPLTGALTRAAFEQAVTNEIAAAQRRGEELTIACLDVVGLRRINLAHGHKIGDEVMAQVAAHVRAGIRGNDPIGRFAGDEIAILLVGATVAQGEAVVQKLIERIAAAPLPVDGEPLVVAMRGVVTPLLPGERSGEAAFFRASGRLRSTAPGTVVVAADNSVHDADNMADHSSVAAGTILGGTYRVLHELSRGAMGVVYRGEDFGLGRAVAIKVLRSDLASDRDLVSKFRTEAATLASLHHANLVQVYSLGEHAGEVYFVMELVEGQPLVDVLAAQSKRGEWFPTEAVTQVAMEIADALDAMHAVGVVHRDVKPANILLDRDRDRAVLVDLGVAAKSGARREAAGTPGFASPESFLGESDSLETDVYGLGATLYYMLAGVPPFGAGGNLAQVVTRQLHEPLVPPSKHRPSLSDGVDAVIAKALDINPKKRWTSASAFALALGRALERLEPDQHARARKKGETAGSAESVMAATTMEAPLAMSPPPGTRGVRAAHFRVASKIIANRLGDAMLRGLVVTTPSLASVLAPTLAPLDWVEVSQLVLLFGELERLSPGDELPRLIGRGTVSTTFTRFFGANPSSLSVAIVLGAAPAFWGRYHEWSRLDVRIGDDNTLTDDTRAEVVLDGNPGSAKVCAMIAGELERIVELAGGTEVIVTHSACACLGASRCRYDIAWTAS